MTTFDFNLAQLMVIRDALSDVNGYYRSGTKYTEILDDFDDIAKVLLEQIECEIIACLNQ